MRWINNTAPERYLRLTLLLFLVAVLGIFVFRTASIEAHALAASDPSVQAGGLALDIDPWMVPERVLP